MGLNPVGCGAFFSFYHISLKVFCWWANLDIFPKKWMPGCAVCGLLCTKCVKKLYSGPTLLTF